MIEKPVIIIGGTTASGKSALAVDLARALGGGAVIINADSMQVYRNAPVLAAIPTLEERGGIAHRLFGIKDISEGNSVAEWLGLAVAEIRSAWASGKVPIVVGGTGLYIDALINGLSEIPSVDGVPVLPLAEMREVLRIGDLKSYEKLKPNDAVRIARAYKVLKATGRALSDWQADGRRAPLADDGASFCAIKIVPAMAELEERIAARFDAMMERGAASEAEAVFRLGLARDLPGMKMLGLAELMDYLDGRTGLEEAARLAKLHSRQYAKRQRTWFSRQLAADAELDSSYDGEKGVLKKILTVARERLAL